MASSPAQLPGGKTAGSDHLARAHALAPRLAEAADEIERARELPPNIVEALVEGGFFRMLLPRSLGGAELDPPSYAAVLEELAKADASTAWCLGQNSGCSMIAPYLPAETAREIFGPAHGILAWGPDVPNAGKAVAVEGGYRVTGQWGFATGSRHASWLGAHVPIFEPDGTPRLNANGRPFIRTVLFPKTSARIIDNWQVVGLRGTGSDSYAAADLFVPQKYTAGRDNEAERREPGPLYRFTSGMIYAASFSAVSLGIARGALDAFLVVARDKIPRGQRRTLRENNVIQSQVAQCEARIGSSRAFLQATLEEMWQEASRSGRLSPEQHVKIRLASTWAINQARDVVVTVYNAAGAAAIFNENPFERRLRDMHAGSQQGQGRPLHFETVGQILLGLEPEGRMFR
ncbi:MAG TPA: acyl-CoA dehydrogenase family protein [Stellaceae bacterium]|nr:acyl-CoA dehydrogenase family protein [Stellaceae bacterium]